MAARASSIFSLCTFVAATVFAPATASVATAKMADGDDPAPTADAVGFLVVRENGSGSASSAKTLVQNLVSSIAKDVGWPSATSKYTTKRKTAAKYVKESKPAFGFLTMGTYLGLRKQHTVKPLAQIETNANGSAQFYLISQNQFTVDGCKGKTLASNHVNDSKFIDGVVSGGAFALSDFTVAEMRRPGQTIKAVIDGEAECGLIDEAQAVAMSKVEGGGALRPVWASKPMPAFVVVAFESATDEQTAAFQSQFATICDSPEGRATCDASGISTPKPVKPDAFAADEAAYDK